MQNATLPTNIPSSVETGTKTWRISDGSICTGRESEGTLETREAIVGYLRRVGIHEGVTQTGDEYAKLEAEIETNEGMVSVSTPLKNATSGKPTYSSCISFAEGLIDCAKGELIQIKAGQSKQLNKYGKHSTYANVHHIVQQPSGKFTAQQTKKFPWVGDMPEYGDELLNALIEQVKKHDAYADRPKRANAEDETDSWDAFQSALENAGWPSVPEAKAEYLKIASKAGGETYAELADVPGSVWDGMAGVVMDGKPMPKALQAVADAKANAKPSGAAAGAIDDPFADE